MSTSFKLKNGAQFLTTEAPGGIYNASQLKKLAELCEGSAAFVKATEDQRLALILPDDQVDATREELKSLGLTLRPYMTGVHQPTSCIGELCPDSEQDALTTAIDVSQELDSIKSTSPLRIGINGCAKCCVPCHTLDIAVMGEAAGYRITLGGKNSHLPELGIFMGEGVPANELPKILRRVVDAYQATANEGETLQEVMERCGSGEFVKALEPYSQDAGGSTVESFAAEPEAASETISSDELSTSTDSPEQSGEGLEIADDVPLDLADESVVAESAPDEEKPGQATLDPGVPPELTQETLPDAEMALEAKLMSPDAEDEAMPLEDSSVAAPADVDQPLELAEKPIEVSEEQGTIDIDPSQSMDAVDNVAPDINPNEQQAATSELKSDVMIGTEPMPESAETAGATEASEEEENEFEAGLEASIEEEKAIEAGVEAEDDESSERQKTLSMVQGSLEAKTPDLNEPIESMEISEADSQALELSEVEMEPELIDENSESPVYADEATGSAPESSQSSEDSGWALAALVPQGGSSIEFQFESGAKVSFDLSRITVPATGRTLRVGSQDFTITPQGSGYSVATTGMSVTLPGNKAA